MQGDGWCHFGDPEVEVVEDEEVEVEVLEEENPNCGRGNGPKVLKSPRAPTQREIDASVATHLPHAAWCGICLEGRGRSSPHREGEGETRQEMVAKAKPAKWFRG